MSLPYSDSNSQRSTLLSSNPPIDISPTLSQNCTINYASQSPIFFSQSELLRDVGRVTLKSSVHGIVNHLRGAIIEYPISGTVDDMAIAHIFPIDPLDFVHPKDNIQYSLGGQHSGQSSVSCFLLRDKDSGSPVKCKQTRYSCEYINHPL